MAAGSSVAAKRASAVRAYSGRIVAGLGQPAEPASLRYAFCVRKLSDRRSAAAFAPRLPYYRGALTGSDALSVDARGVPRQRSASALELGRSASRSRADRGNYLPLRRT